MQELDCSIGEGESGCVICEVGVLVRETSGASGTSGLSNKSSDIYQKKFNSTWSDAGASQDVSMILTPEAKQLSFETETTGSDTFLLL